MARFILSISRKKGEWQLLAKERFKFVLWPKAGILNLWCDILSYAVGTSVFALMVSTAIDIASLT